MRPKLRSVDMKIFSEQASMERAEHTARIASLNGDIYELEDKQEVLERCNIIAESCQSLLFDEHNSRDRQAASGTIGIEEMAQRLVDMSKYVSMFSDGLNCHA